jgi:hypothetical protein
MTKREELFSTRSVRQLSDAIKLLEAVFSMPSVPRCYKQDKSGVEVVGRQSSGSKGVNTEAEEVTVLESVIRQRLVKTQKTERT